LVTKVLKESTIQGLELANEGEIDGVLLSGLFLHGAKYDSVEEKLVDMGEDSQKTTSPLNILQLTLKHCQEVDLQFSENNFQIPLYKNSQRIPRLIFQCDLPC